MRYVSKDLAHLYIITMIAMQSPKGETNKHTILWQQKQKKQRKKTQKKN